MIEVELPDGTVVEFPQGTDEATIRRVLGGLTKPDPMQERRDRWAAAKAGTLTVSPESAARAAAADQKATDNIALSNYSPIYNAMAKIAQGIPFVGEYVDEIGSAGGNARLKAVQGAMDREYPKTSTALNITGGLIGSAGMVAGGSALGLPSVGAYLPASVAGKAATTGLLGAAGGGAEGFISGYGAGEGDGRFESAQERGLVGAAFGGALGLAAPLAATGVRKALEAYKGSDIAAIARAFNVSPEAAKSIRAFIASDDFDAAEAAIRQAGPDGMLADAGGGFTQALDTSMQSGGAAARIGREAVDGRAIAADARMTGLLDNALGGAEGIKTAQSGIRASTAADRSSLYGQAFDTQIDWRSPQGEQLRGLLQTTPDDVLAKAARNRSMSARAASMPDSAYAGEFAPSVSVRPGPAAVAADDAERAAVNDFFQLYGEMPKNFGMKRPLTDAMKRMGGIQPNSPLGQELKAQGITPQTTPGLFNRNGLYDVDNLEPSLFPDSINMKTDGNGYMDRQTIIDSLTEELRGNAVRSIDEGLNAKSWDGMDQALPGFEARRNALNQSQMLPEAPPPVSDIVPMQTVYDIDQIKRALDEIKRTNDGQGLLGGQTEYGVEAGKRARELRDLLAEISPEYKQALAVSSDTIGRVQGVEFGSKLLDMNTTREAVAEFVDGATGGELAAVKQGLRSRIDDTLASVKASLTNPDTDIKEIIKLWTDLSSRANREKVTMILGQSEADRLFPILDEAGAQLQTRGNVARNTATAARTAGQASVRQASEPGAVGVLAQGRPIDAARRVVQVLTGNTAEARLAKEQGIYKEIAQILTTKRGQEAQDALRIVQRAMEGQPVSSADAARVAKQVTAGLALGGYQIGTKSLSTR